jgi:hypothetical protein
MLVKFRYCVEHRQTRAGSTLGVVVVRLRVAEASHHAVAEVLGDMPAEPLDRLRRRMMVLADDLAPLFGIEMAGNLGRADEIAEKNRQMPSLARNVVLNVLLHVLLNVLARLDRSSRSGSIERCRTVVAKFRSWFIVRAAARTLCRHWRSAFAAKLRSLGIFR